MSLLSRRDYAPVRAFAGFVLAVVLLACHPVRAQDAEEFHSRIRGLVASGHIEQAIGVANQWMEAFPRDLDAKAWHARLLAWSGHRPEAEAEYRALLAAAPSDRDLLMGLADLLRWQKRYGESLRLVERACGTTPERTDCRLQRARLLLALGRRAEAKVEYTGLLEAGTAAAEARAALAELGDARRHQLSIGTQSDLLNYAENSFALAASLDSRWNRRWSSFAAVAEYQRFGQAATRFEGSGTWRLTATNALTLGGATAGAQGIVPRAEAQFAYDRGFRLPERGPLRGVEALYEQRWLWYRDARVMNLSPAAVLDLPKGWNWLVRLSMSRVAVTGAHPAWRPSTSTRLSFPVHRLSKGYVLFGTGVENFGTIDQVLLEATRTIGAGLRTRMAPRQELITFVHYQSIAPGRSQWSVGVSYAFRF